MAETLDILYPSGFYSYQAPVHLNYVAALAGRAPPAPQGAPFTYLDLGCGDGFTITLLAAAYPESRFIGVDLNPGHIALGRARIAAGNLANVELIEGDFSAWRELDLPECHYVAMHGVYAWISDAAREAILELVAARLRPDGLLYAGYNAYPGWAGVAPLRQFLLHYTSSMPGDPVAKIAATLRHLQELRAKDAAYFHWNPIAAAALDDMTRKDPRYVAHEIYAPYWSPRHFADMAADMARAGLVYTGSADLHHNDPRSSVRGAHAPLLVAEGDPIRAEPLRDLLNNTFFRRDVFVKGNAFRADAKLVAERLAASRFGCRVEATTLERSIPIPDGRLPLEGPLYDGLRNALGSGSATIEELCHRPALAGRDVLAVAEALRTQAIGNQIVPFIRPVAAVTETPRDWSIPLPLNRALLAETSPILMPIAPATGIAAPIVRDEGLVLLSVAEAGPERAAEFAWREGSARGTRLKMDGAMTTTRPGHDAAFASTLKTLQSRLTKLVELGVIAPR